MSAAVLILFELLEEVLKWQPLASVDMPACDRPGSRSQNQFGCNVAVLASFS